MKLTRAHPPGTVNGIPDHRPDLVGIALSNVLKGRTVSDYLSEKIWRPAGMEADANWVLDKTGIERGGCCISATLRDYARFGLYIAKGDAGPASAVLPADWIDEARTPVWPATDGGSGYGWFWWVRQDGGYEAVGAYGQSVTIYPKDDIMIAVATPPPRGSAWIRYCSLEALCKRWTLPRMSRVRSERDELATCRGGHKKAGTSLEERRVIDANRLPMHLPVQRVAPVEPQGPPRSLLPCSDSPWPK